jgi:hypothetical protein
MGLQGISGGHALLHVPSGTANHRRYSDSRTSAVRHRETFKRWIRVWVGCHTRLQRHGMLHNEKAPFLERLSNCLFHDSSSRKGLQLLHPAWTPRTNALSCSCSLPLGSATAAQPTKSPDLMPTSSPNRIEMMRESGGTVTCSRSSGLGFDRQGLVAE